MFHVWTLLPAAYVCWRFVKKLNSSLIIKLLLGLIVVSACEFHLISRVAFGTMFSPELPRPVMLFLGWMFGSTLFLALMLLIKDICGVFGRYLFRRSMAEREWIRPAMLAAAAVLACAGVYNAVQVPEVTRTEIVIEKLPPEFDGFTLVQLTDLHASRLLTRSWMQSVVDKTNALHPDLVVVTGDMADGTVNARRNDVAPLAFLKAPFGVYAITGNHEYYFNADAWVKEYSRLGLHFLNNSHVRLMKNGAHLTLAGVTDDVAPEYNRQGPDLKKALNGLSGNEAIILLDHRPGNAGSASASGVSLQLSGHTHGGMIRALDIVAGPANNGFVSGLYHAGNMALYVSNGAGLWNGFPLRLGKASEITFITLRAR